MRPGTANALHAHLGASYVLFGAEILFGIIQHPDRAWVLAFLIPAPLVLPFGLGVMLLTSPVAGLANLIGYGVLFAGFHGYLKKLEETRGRWGKGLCETCGYDLQATPERCPECGQRSVKGGNRTDRRGVYFS